MNECVRMRYIILGVPFSFKCLWDLGICYVMSVAVVGPEVSMNSVGTISVVLAMFPESGIKEVVV